MNKVNWTAVIVIAIIALLVLMFGASLLGGWSYGGWGYGGGGMMGPWMMGGMMFMWLFPLGFIVLTILGVVWLVRAVGGSSNPVTPGNTCPSCGHSIQSD
jgi:uncharacterized membrane protein